MNILLQKEYTLIQETRLFENVLAYISDADDKNLWCWLPLISRPYTYIALQYESIYWALKGSTAYRKEKATCNCPKITR